LQLKAKINGSIWPIRPGSYGAFKVMFSTLVGPEIWKIELPDPFGTSEEEAEIFPPDFSVK
jgi:hypothetical protein